MSAGEGSPRAVAATTVLLPAEPGTTPAPVPVSWNIVTVLAMGAFASSGMMRVLDPLLPRLALEFGTSIGHAAWGVIAFATAYGCMQLFYGPLADRKGKLRVMSTAAALASVAAAACAAAGGSFGVFLAARAFAGACCAASIPLAMAWIGDAVSYDDRQPVLARFMIGQMMGMASGQVLGGFAAVQSHWQWPFLFYAVVFAVAAFLMARRVERPASTSSPSGNAGNALLDVLRQPWARIVLAATFGEAVCFLGAFTFVATHLHRVEGLSLALAGLIMISFSAGGIAFAMFARRWVARLGEVRLAVVGTLVSAASLAVVALTRQPAIAVAAVFFSGVGFYMLHNTLQANATQMMPHRRGAGVSLFATSFFVGQSVGVSVFGAIGDHFGTGPALLMGAASVIPIGLWLGSRLRLRAAETEPIASG